MNFQIRNTLVLALLIPSTFLLTACTATENGSSTTSSDYGSENVLSLQAASDECLSGLILDFPKQGTVGQPVTGRVSIPGCLENLATGVTWDFGDGTTGAGFLVQHTYTMGGTFSVIATVAMNDGGPIPLSATIVIPGGPVVDPEPEVPAYWITGSYGTCSVTCGGGTQTRAVTCQDQTGKVLPEASCKQTKPITTQSCNPQTCAVGNSGSWMAYGNTLTLEEFSNVQSCADHGFFRTGFTTYNQPSSCGDVGLICNLMDVMGISFNGAWTAYMKCGPTPGVSGNWQPHVFLGTENIANIRPCAGEGFVRTGLQTFTTPSSCGDVGLICDNSSVMGIGINGAWPNHFKCHAGGGAKGSFSAHNLTVADRRNAVRACSEMGIFRTGFTTYHLPTSCGDVGAVCDLFNVMGVNITGAWPHFLKCN